MTAVDDSPAGLARLPRNGRAKQPVPDGFALDPGEVAATKRRLVDAGVKFCYATYVDVHGIPKAKATPIDQFEKMCAGHELYTVGALEGMGLAGPHEDECATVPDLDSMVICPWNRRLAWFSSDLYYHGEPYANSPRGLLKRQMDRAAERGLVLNLGIEPEFYVYREGGDGRPVPITTSRFQGPNACYDFNLTDESLAFLEPMAEALEALGWGLFSFDQECGRGQHEFDFGFADAVTMSDRFVFLRTLAKKVARSIGATATFMPKPFADDFRSGAHFNMSIADLDRGENLFEPGGAPGELAEKYGIPVSDRAYHFAAGVLEHAAAITAMTCPTYNSYQGLVAQGDLDDFSWAPVLEAYGRNNRSAMLRLPLNRACVENRAVDMSVNPYLAAALTLAAGLEGIEHALDPGEPINVDMYRLTMSDLKAMGVDRLPPTLLHALDAFEADELAAETFGPYRDIYLDHKRKEWARGFYRVTDEQRAFHLDFI